MVRFLLTRTLMRTEEYVVQFLRDHVRNNDSLPDRAKQVLI